MNIPYNYYDVGTCRPEIHAKDPYIKKNWGEALAGERWAYSPYEVTLKTTHNKNEPDPAEF